MSHSKKTASSLCTTGARQVLVRPGFSDADTLGGDNYAMAVTGNLDAPDLMPQGSTRVHNTIKLTPSPSVGHREWASGHMPPGAAHDGPEAVPGTLYLHPEEPVEQEEPRRRARP